MTAPIDLEALRAALDAITRGKGTCEFEGDMVTAERLDDAHYAVELALAELTTRRARDAEVEALVEMAQLVHDECDAHNDFAIDAKRRLRIAIAPFTGATP